MKFNFSALSAVFPTVILAIPISVIHTDVASLNIPPQSPEVLAAFHALPKEILSADKAGNIPVYALEERVLITRENIVLYITADVNWAGRNEPLQSASGQCYGLGNGWNDVVSSAGPNVGHCDLYEKSGCSGPSLMNIREPGVADLHSIGWGDRISSYRCFDS